VAASTERAEEFIQVTLKLWLSWDPKRFPRDKESGVFFEDEFQGKYFRISGALNVFSSDYSPDTGFYAGHTRTCLSLSCLVLAKQLALS